MQTSFPKQTANLPDATEQAPGAAAPELVELYFSDLRPEAQRRLLEAFGIADPALLAIIERFVDGDKLEPPPEGTKDRKKGKRKKHFAASTRVRVIMQSLDACICTRETGTGNKLFPMTG